MEYVLENAYITVSVQTLGGALHSIKNKSGLEYLWQGDPEFWGGQAPVLFPICGSLRGNQAQIGDGKITKMPRHGIVRKKEFACEEQKADSILFTIMSDEETLQQFPYEFRLGIKYTLDRNTVGIQYDVENLGSVNMPFFIGGHPGFNCPLLPDEKYDDYKLIFSQKETCSVPTPITETGLIDMENRKNLLNEERELPLTHALFEKDAIILDELSSRNIRLCSVNHTNGIELEFTDFPYLILWSSNNNGPFIALEPWNGLSTCSDESDVFEEKRNLQVLKPLEHKTYSYSIRIF